ncbi:hypothetical protein MMC17_001640 [Xylographa soralifera]|nr:hypothetical protein [Xylographa soralifera]
MLLVFSDMFKATWYFVFPIVEFARGQETITESPWCQASGFLTAFATEASDFAILMIAVHAALYVFQSNTARGEAGLYKHRYIAYMCWIIYPTLMASLAFVNPMHPYISSGNYCSLPVRPFWYRLALSWIPRYLIIITIILIYLWIYIFVKYKFKGFNDEHESSYRRDSRASISYSRSNPVRDHRRLSNSASRSARRNSQPAAAAIHRLLPTAQDGVASCAISHNSPAQTSPQQPTGGPEWEDYTFGGSKPVSPLPQTIQVDPPSAEEHVPRTERLESAATIYTEAAFRKFSLATTSSHTSYNVIQALREPRIARSAPTFVNPTSATTGLVEFQGSPAPMRSFNDESSPIHMTNNDGNEDPAPTPAERHRDIKRKLRLLFIYPLVYMLMWTLPFVMHCLQYTDYYSQNPPYVLAVLVSAVLALQGAVDSVLFSTREKPWRHLNNSRFWGWGLQCSKRKIKGSSRLGKDSEEVAYDNNQALSRRDEEAGVLKNAKGSEKPKRPVHKREASWWEQEGRMRMDSVMLGTDHNCAEHGEVEAPHHTDTIKEEDVNSTGTDVGLDSQNFRLVGE